MEFGADGSGGAIALRSRALRRTAARKWRPPREYTFVEQLRNEGRTTSSVSNSVSRRADAARRPEPDLARIAQRACGGCCASTLRVRSVPRPVTPERALT